MSSKKKKHFKVQEDYFQHFRLAGELIGILDLYTAEGEVLNFLALDCGPDVDPVLIKPWPGYHKQREIAELERIRRGA
jgi:hypothetical protein